MLANGWVFAIIYALFFENLHTRRGGFGALIGATQGLFVVVALLPVLPGIHSRMVSDFRGPEPTRLLEPPGFLARTTAGAPRPCWCRAQRCNGLFSDCSTRCAEAPAPRSSARCA